MIQSFTNLEINNYLYESAISFIRKKICFFGLNSIIKSIERVAGWAWFNHPGRFADGALENFVLKVGREIKEKVNDDIFFNKFGRENKNITLHIATELYSVGGHSKFLIKWTERDKSSKHIIILTYQKTSIPRFLEEKIKKAGNIIIKLPLYESKENKAIIIRNISRKCKRVILHTHPYDSVPILAFAKENVPPIGMFNHAHFSFCLGFSVSDLVINTLEYFRKISEKYRFAKKTIVLHGGVNFGPVLEKNIDKKIAKRQLGLPENAVVIMSMGWEGYFKPIKEYNFFSTIKKIINEIPNVFIIIIGVDKNSKLVPPELKSNKKILLKGYVTDPTIYYEASDIFLESFPMPSLGAVNEAIVYGEAFPVPVYGQGENILRVNRDDFKFPSRPTDEEIYLDYIKKLVMQKNEIRAIARNIKRKIKESDECFEENLLKVNNMLDNITHKPFEIPITKKNDEDDCKILAELNYKNVGEKINDLFSFIPSIVMQIDATSKGYQKFNNSLNYIIDKINKGIKRKVLRVPI